MATAPKEVSFPTPYGHIAGKVWNEDAPTAVLCLHGWQDNAGSFDLLAPLLPNHLCLVAIDLHGHGLSSPKPLGFSSNTVDYVVTIDRIVKQMNWKQVVLIGHSMGGVLSLLYSGIRPSVVHSVVTIDIMRILHTPPEKLPSRNEFALDTILANEEKILKGIRPSYTYEELLQKSINSFSKSLTEKGARVLLERGSKKLADGTYTFTHDLQVRNPNLATFSLEQVLSYAQRIQCRLLLIRAQDGLDQKTDETEQLFQIYRSKSAEYVYHCVPGKHHVHLEAPELVAPLICDFLKEEKVSNVHNNVNEDGKPSIAKFIVTHR